MRLVCLAVGYFVAGRVGLALAMFGSMVTLVWLPTRIALAALFRWGWRFWQGVWLGDAVGVILGGMALVTYRHEAYRRLLGPKHRSALVASAFWLTLISVAWSVVVSDNPVEQMLSLTVPVVVLVWVAFRLGSSPAAVAVLILAGVVSWLLVHQSGPFADAALYLSITKFWAYINTVAIVALLVSRLTPSAPKPTRNWRAARRGFAA